MVASAGLCAAAANGNSSLDPPPNASGLPVLTRSSESTLSSPNIIVIVGDDLGTYDVAEYRKSQLTTPSIDELKRNGLTLDHFYVYQVGMDLSVLLICDSSSVDHADMCANAGISAVRTQPIPRDDDFARGLPCCKA